MNASFKGLLIAVLVVLTSACAQSPQIESSLSASPTSDSPNIAAVPTNSDSATFEPLPPLIDERDPFENVNRDLWEFNWEVLDKNVLRPLAVGYTSLPQPVQNSVRSVVTNLEEPGYAVNSLLQGKFRKSGIAVSRFFVNSTIGILGIFDVANSMGIKRHKEDFGQTLAVAGVNNGPFLMLPGYGPSTFRDGLGDFVDGQIFPMYLIDWPWNLVKTGLKAVYTRADLMQQEQLIYDSSDSYIFVRDAYFQNQNFKVFDGNPPIKEEFKFDDAFLDEIDNF